jgi:hypothetical protein
MERDDRRLRDAVRAWLAAYDEFEAAQAGTDAGDYAAALDLAEQVSIARMRLEQELVGLGWSPPRAGSRENTR